MQMESSQSPQPTESLALSTIVGGLDNIDEFFEKIWQNECRVFSTGHSPREYSTAKPASDGWDQSTAASHPLENLITHGWDVLFDLMVRSRKPSDAPEWTPPIFFRNQESLSLEEKGEYDDSPFAAFLDGCSVVINHADFYSPWIAQLCEDLQRSFPHAYANTYWTPPRSQAVPAHADDRDVLVIQVVGRKTWKVYSKVPIPYPYPHEQVGKGSVPVPKDVFEEGLTWSGTLKPGDVLYMPRGFVHEACSTADESSFHITIALATHDWTMAGIVSSIVETSLTQKTAFRQALPRRCGSILTETMDERDKSLIKNGIEEALGIIRDQLTLDSIEQRMERKMSHHNSLASKQRSKVMEIAHNFEDERTKLEVVGQNASDKVFWSTTVRPSTEEEKLSITQSRKRQVGLQVRPECFDGLMSLLSQVREHEPIIVELLDELLPPSSQGICRATMICFVRRCVELGAFAVVPDWQG